jgi:hypothetical protein
MTINFTAEQISLIVKEARQSAFEASDKFFKERLGGQDQFACGFAWVTIHGIRGNTKIGRALKENGFSPAYGGGLQLWNPSNYGCQNIDTLEEGARAAAEVFKSYGFERAYAGSRLD